MRPDKGGRGSRRPMQQNLRRARKAMKKMVQIAGDHDDDDAGVNDDRTFKRQKGILPRKLRRKEARKLKKAKKHAFLTGKNLKEMCEDGEKKTKKEKPEKKVVEADQKKAEKKAKREEKIKMEKEEQRKRELIAANEDEDKNIRRLEKELNFRKKRKTKEKITPTAFKDDGLDYLLDIVDPKMLEAAMDDSLMEIEKEAEDNDEGGSSDEEGGDFMMDDDDDDDDDEDEDDELEEDSEEDGSHVDDTESSKPKEMTSKRKHSDNDANSRKKSRRSDEDDDNEVGDDDSEGGENFHILSKAAKKSLGKGTTGQDSKIKAKQNVTYNDTDSNGDDDDDDDDNDGDEEDDFDDSDQDDDSDEEGGRKEIKMDPYGNLIGQKAPERTSAYIPPHKRAEMMGQSVDAERKAKMERLRKQLKGAINRLSESNALSIANQIEELYLSNSRNDMNESLCALIQEACISSSLTPDRLAMEHVLLIAILHSVIGTEVGAHVLQSIATRFDETHSDDGNYGDGKEIDNIVMLFVHLYNFKIVHCVLIYDLIKKLAECFTERHIELLLQILKSAGGTLRKDDPSSLKDIILLIQSKANGCPDELKQQSRVKFMLETIGALRNNNLRRIPNYDPTNLDRLRKLHKSIIKDRGGSDDSILRISLADLIMAYERGRWWIVGSAWSGHGPKQDISKESSGTLDQTTTNNQEISNKIVELSRQQRMNTDIRRTIFSIIMTGEDYTDAFEKLVRLGQKGGRDREVVHVTLDCCQQERCFNPYYAYLGTKLCQFDRKFRMAFQFALWDKIRMLEELSTSSSKNLALLISHLISSKALPLSVLKIIEFADMNKDMVKFLSNLLTDLLLEKQDSVISAIFGGIAGVTKLRVLREGLGLFMHYFLVNANKKRLSKTEGGGVEVLERLKKKIVLAERAIQGDDGPVKL